MMRPAIKRLILTALISYPFACTTASPTGASATAFKSNQWYIFQLLQDKNPLANYIAAVKCSNLANPETEDVSDSDMFIKITEVSTITGNRSRSSHQT